MIVVGGENLIDFIQEIGDNGNPIYRANPGGSPYNCAMAVGQQQVPVGFLTPISTDTLGNLLADGLMDAGVILCGDRRNEPTSLAVVSLKGAAASYQFYRENTADRMVSISALKGACPDGMTGFHVGSLALTGGADADVWADFYVSLHTHGVFTSLDPNIRAAFINNRSEFMERLDRMLVATDLLKLSDEDLEWLEPGVEPETAARRMLARSTAKLMVVTLGADGAFAITRDEFIRVDPAPVSDMKDTVGAGDTFMATLLTGLHNGGRIEAGKPFDINGLNILALLERASVAAALNCEQVGCNPPDLATLDAETGT